MHTKLNCHPLRLWSIPLLAMAFCLAAAGARGADKGKAVDSGTFSVYVAGQRVATETFQIVQGSSFSTTTSEFKSETPQGKSAQKAELQIAATGELRRYEWHELSPGKAQIVVEPSEQFLIEHIVPEAPDKPIEQPFVLPLSTMMLDDYFFSQREILAWRYLSQACSEGLKQCRPGKVQFGVLVPRQRAPLIATLEYAGVEKVNVRGVQQELNRVNLTISDDSEWALYLDGNMKLVRILIPNDKTEVVRD
jgi:hypothetical protein